MKTNSVQTEETVKEEKASQSTPCRSFSNKCVQTVEENTCDTKPINKLENDFSAVTNKETFEKYPCFYCETKIASEQHMDEHRLKCCGSTRLFCTAPVGLPMPPPSVGFSLGFPPPHHLSPFSLLGSNF